MSYIEPHTSVTQSFVNVTPATTESTQNVCVVGPVYHMVDDEEQATPYDAGAGNIYTYTETDAGEIVDTRQYNDDELEYPVQLTLEDAKIERIPIGATPHGAVPATGKILTSTPAAAFTNVVTAEANSILFSNTTPANPTSKHYVDVVSCVRVGDVRTITLSGPYAQLLDEPTIAAGFVRRMYRPGEAKTLKITSISADRTQIICVDTGADDTWSAGGVVTPVAGMYTIGYVDDTLAVSALHPDYELGPYTITKLDNNRVFIPGLPDGVAYTGVGFQVYATKDVVFADARDAGCTFPTTGTISVPSGLLALDGAPILSGAIVHLKYRALRTLLKEAMTRIDISDYANSIATELGAMVPANTGAYAVYQACRNSNIDVYFTGVDETYYTDIEIAFAEAESYLRDQEDIFHIVPCSMLPSVHALFDAHVDYCSDPDLGLFRVTFLAHDLVTDKSLYDGTTAVTEGMNTLILSDGDASFTGTVNIGNSVKIASWTHIEPTAVLTAGTTGGAAPAQPVTWDPATNTLVITHTAVAAWTAIEAIITSGDIVGRCIKWVSSGAAAVMSSTSADTGMYIDDDHPTGSNSQTFADLGYKIRSAVITSPTVMTLVLEEVGTNPSLVFAQAGIADQNVSYTIYDSVLSAIDEYNIVNTHFTIDAIPDAHTLSVDEGLYNWGTSGAPVWHTAKYYGLTYSVVDDMTKDEQAAYIAAYCASYNNRRTRFVWPPAYEHTDGTILKGYNVAAQTAGAYSALPPQESLTKHSIAGGNLLMYSNTYFKRTQLNIMAAGGITIFTQSVEGALPQCRHQQSTATTTVYYREPSITHAVDYVSKMVKTMLNTLIGQYNITEELFTTAALGLESIKQKVTKKKARIGGVVKTFEVVDLSQDTVDIDYVVCEVDCIPNVPCNGFKTTIKVK